MRYVAINTAGANIEIAVVYDETRDYCKIEKVMAAEQLLPAVDAILDKMGRSLNDFNHFVCVVGPGSFTGIRIGVNTVRAFAYALKRSVYGVTYNRVMAYNGITDGAVVTVAEGGTSVCYIAAYDGENTIIEPQCIYKKDIPAFVSKLSAQVVSDFSLEGAHIYSPDGTALMKAAEYAIKNKSGTEPIYIRKPQPDRKEDDI